MTNLLIAMKRWTACLHWSSGLISLHDSSPSTTKHFRVSCREQKVQLIDYLRTFEVYLKGPVGLIRLSAGFGSEFAPYEGEEVGQEPLETDGLEKGGDGP